MFARFEFATEPNGLNTAASWLGAPGTRWAADRLWQRNQHGSPGPSVFISRSILPSAPVGAIHPKNRSDLSWGNSTHDASAIRGSSPLKWQKDESEIERQGALREFGIMIAIDTVKRLAKGVTE